MVPRPKGATGREGERAAATVGVKVAARVGVRAAARVAKGRRGELPGCEGRGKGSGNSGCGGEGLEWRAGGGRARATGGAAYILDQLTSGPNGWKSAHRTAGCQPPVQPSHLRPNPAGRDLGPWSLFGWAANGWAGPAAGNQPFWADFQPFGPLVRWSSI
jgi:hypothetical protein